MSEPPVESTTEAEDDRLGRDRPIEPGEPNLENVLFVLLGVLIGVGVVYRAATIFGG